MLAHALAGRAEVDAVLSLAGRTGAPMAQPLPMRVGGFGGVDGLSRYLSRERIDLLVDATHPFAAQISQHARVAAKRTGCRLIVVGRPPWRPQAGDDWREVEDMAAAATALGELPRRVFLTVGRLQLAAFAARPRHHYLVRTIDPAAPGHLRDATFIEARGPFDAEAETRLLRDHRIDMLVTKNSGGDAAGAKLEAARRLGLPVVLVRRPDAGGPTMSVEEAVAAIVAHRATGAAGSDALRGV